MLNAQIMWGRLRAKKLRAPHRAIMSSARGYAESAPLPVGKMAALVFAALVVAIIGATAFYMFNGSRTAAPVSVVSDPMAVPAKRVIYTKPLRLAEPPPPPYVKLK
jgi:hypothetical protein